MACREGLRPRVRRATDGTSDRAGRQEAALGGTAVRSARRRWPRAHRGRGRRDHAPDMTLADFRREYLGEPLSEIDSERDPFRQFARWFARACELDPEATAMALATASRDGRPSARIVLLKAVDDRGFVFYTNYDSRKARDIAQTGRASLLFFWRALERQVRIDGAVEQVSEGESDAY